MMGRSINRMQFLRADFTGERIPLRPPWARPDPAFIDACEPCSACVDACPQHIIKAGRGGYPEVHFGAGECTFCRACLVACAPGALCEVDLEHHGPSPPWTAKAVIASHCIAWSGVECRVCDERCRRGAIAFRAQRGAVARPRVNLSLCDGCGACYAPCPVGAVSILTQAD